MAAPLPTRLPSASPPPDPTARADDKPQDSRWFEQVQARPQAACAQPANVPTRGLLLVGLLASAVLLLWMHMLASAPHLPLDWPDADASVATVAPSDLAALAPWVGRPVLALVQPDGQPFDPTRLGALQTGRWIVADEVRARQQAIRERIATALQQPELTWHFAPTGQAKVPVASRGLAGLGLAAWLLAGLALLLLLAAAALALTRPGPAASLFVLMAAAQALHLLLIGADQLPGLGTTAWLTLQDLPLRWAADGVLAAAMVHLTALYPLRLRPAWPVAGLAWALAAALLLGLLGDWLPGAWWWAQAWTLACGLAAVALLQRSQRHRASRSVRLLRHWVLAAVASGALLTIATALAAREHPQSQVAAEAGWVAWHLFVACLIGLAPFILRVRRVVREFALLAGIGSVAASAAWLLEAGLDLDALAALVLAFALSAALYGLVRRWMRQPRTSLDGLRPTGRPGGPPRDAARPATPVSAERLFDSLYRVARALEPAPEQAERQIGALLREVFDPLQIDYSARTVSRIRISQDGSALVVPYPQIGDGSLPQRATGSILLRHAQQGRRLFNADDSHLAERMIEQLSRAVAYDRAVERGRAEERTRLAQDLHDDIGARLLTLMYRAPNAEIEEYIRHTLQDLKTLTRGLAASNHRLSHAAAEWKSDLSQRLTASGCDLRWSFSADRDLQLNVVQWSGLTRVIRELVNNIISHARATQVEVSVQVDRGQLLLSIVDDGIGRAPAGWSHGLGLGGVRKRVKLLGGQVQWLEVEPRGIRCEVRAPLAETRPG